MVLSNAQMSVLVALSKPFGNVKQHPRDAYSARILHALENQKLVEFYDTSFFLHGAVRLTELGKNLVNEPIKVIKVEKCSVCADTGIAFNKYYGQFYSCDCSKGQD